MICERLQQSLSGVLKVQMRISRTPLPGEHEFDEDTKAFLAMLRSIPEVSAEEDPNDWLSQIWGNLRRTPEERLKNWTRLADEALRYKASLIGVPHIGFSPRRVMRTLVEHDVAFVFVGMGAGYVQGTPYPSANTDFTPSLDADNLARVDRALDKLAAQPLEHDLWNRVDEPTLPGFTRLLTSAGMVNIVDALPGVGNYHRLMENADSINFGQDLSVWVASLKDVICSKENVERSLGSERNRDALHVMMCKETLQAKEKLQLSANG